MLKGKKALIVGIANERSIAYGIAHAMRLHGADLALTYLNEKMQSRVEKAAQQFGIELVLPCDLTKDDQIDAVAESLKKHWGHVDIIVHAAAFAPADQLQGNYVSNVTREGFRVAHDVSSYSFTALAKSCESILSKQSALLTLSYLGAVRCVSNYNTMGVAKASLEANVRYMAHAMGPKGTRVNAISAGTIKTLASSGIKDFKTMLVHNAEVTPLRRNTTLEEVGNTASFLCSDMASGITGEIVYVDSGYHLIG